MDHLAQLRRIAEDRRQPGRELGAQLAGGLERRVQGEHVVHQRVQVERRGTRGRQARVIAELVDHQLQRADLVDDRLRTARQHLGLGGRQLVGELVLHPLGGELDRRERVLDLVREAPRDLAPGDRALGAHHLAHVVEHHQPAALRARQPRTAHQQRQRRRIVGPRLGAPLAAGGVAAERELALPPEVGVLVELAEGLDELRRGLAQPRQLLERAAHEPVGAGPEDRLGADVRERDAEVLVEHDHAGGQVREHAREPRVRALELLLVALDERARLLELARHRVERLREHAELVAPGVVLDRPEVAGRHRARAGGEHRQRPGHPAGEQERRGDRGEDGQQQRHRHRDPEDALQPGARQRQLLVVAPALLDRLGVLGEQRRHRLHQLQQPQLLAELAAERDRLDHAQLQAARLAVGVRLGRLDRRVEPRAARGAQRGRRRQVGHQAREGAARGQHDPPAAGDDQRLLRADALAHPVQRLRPLALRHVGELGGHRARLGLQVREQRVERGAAEGQARLERALHRHVVPGLHRAAEELNRHRVDQPHRHQRHHDERDREPHHQPRAEQPSAPALPQPSRELEREQQQRHADRDVQPEQQPVVALEQAVVAARDREHRQQHRRERDRHEEGVAQRASDRASRAVYGVKGNRFHSDCGFQSRLVSAEIWKGLGSCAVSSRSRTQPS